MVGKSLCQAKHGNVHGGGDSEETTALRASHCVAICVARVALEGGDGGVTSSRESEMEV